MAHIKLAQWHAFRFNVDVELHMRKIHLKAARYSYPDVCAISLPVTRLYT